MSENSGSLDDGLKRWLRNVAQRWHLKSSDEAAGVLSRAWGEIDHRTRQYPLLGEELRRGQLKIRDIPPLLRGCWAQGHPIESTRLNIFLKTGSSAAAVANLVRHFPTSDREAASRIDSFVKRAVQVAYKVPKGGPDRAGAALLASVLLTSLEPGRFVDFRRKRWREMARTLGYKYEFPLTDNYGKWLVEAGHFAQAVCNTRTFKRYWRYREPCWAMSGICWAGSRPENPSGKVPTPEDFPDDDGFVEGSWKRVLHHRRERKGTLVKLAKQRAWQRDKTLRCEVCGLSFVEVYGELGNKVIEAHHKKPLAPRKRGQRNYVEDIALVCSNCHRMLHRSIEERPTEEFEVFKTQVAKTYSWGRHLFP